MRSEKSTAASWNERSAYRVAKRSIVDPNRLIHGPLCAQYLKSFPMRTRGRVTRTQGNKMRQVRARDAVYLYADDNESFSTALSCTTIASPDGEPVDLTRDEIVTWASERVAISDQFRSKMVQLPRNIGLLIGCRILTSRCRIT